ncbi:MAG: PIG-L family deacetylase [Candidatus Bathyarchaeota archaeon]|nr:PIG-L family deacetylase [Candidatus Bathyarchaeota archaeon]
MSGGILAIVSHPDDETFGCGGTLAVHVEKGYEVNVLCLTCNPAERRAEIIDACMVLGVNEPIVFNDLHVTVDPGLIRRVSDIIVEKNPRVVITHLPFDYHREHKLVYQVVKDAVEWAAHTTTYESPCQVERLLLMEVNTLIPSPHVQVDISGVIEKKKEATDRYTTQLAKFQWGYYQRFNIKKAELRGVQADCLYAEAFLEEPLTSNSPFYTRKATKSLL